MTGIGSKRKNVGGNVDLSTVKVTLLLLIAKVMNKIENLKTVIEFAKIRLMEKPLQLIQLLLLKVTTPLQSQQLITILEF